MPKKQMIAKGCPKCEQQVPVACKACRCGHSFFNAKKSIQAPSTPPENLRRRTQRVRREKPNYYDALEYDKQVKKSRTRNSECDDDEAPVGKPAKPKKRKLKKDEDDEEESINNLTTDKQVQCLIILAELNRKMGTVTWKPI